MVGKGCGLRIICNNLCEKIWMCWKYKTRTFRISVYPIATVLARLFSYPPSSYITSLGDYSGGPENVLASSGCLENFGISMSLLGYDASRGIFLGVACSRDMSQDSYGGPNRVRWFGKDDSPVQAVFTEDLGRNGELLAVLEQTRADDDLGPQHGLVVVDVRGTVGAVVAIDWLACWKRKSASGLSGKV